jgi:hypothetical protein
MSVNAWHGQEIPYLELRTQDSFHPVCGFILG